MKKQMLFAAMAIITLTGCYRLEDDQDKSDVMRQALVPTYASEAALRQVSYGAPQPVKKAGKIVLYNNLLFQVEQDSGIHVFNVTNPAVPQRVGFIRSPLCKELAVRNNHIITNNIDDMVVIDFSNPTAIKEVKRLPGEFSEMRSQYPPQTSVYFVCPDPSKGIVINWTMQSVKNPKCRR